MATTHTKPKHFLPLAALVVSVAVFGAACSSASHRSTATTKAAPSSTNGATSSTSMAADKAAFVVKANAICTVMNAKVKAVVTPLNNPAVAAEATDRIRAIVADALRQQRALAVPVGDRATLRVIFASVDKLLADWANLAAAFRNRDQDAERLSTGALTSDAAVANRLSIAYGLTVCGS